MNVLLNKAKRRLNLVLTLFAAMLILNSCGKTEGNVSNETDIPGFKLIEKRFVQEVDADVYYFEHVKTGAPVLKIASNDVNKTFSVSFKTEPTSNSGVPHIMEHSVLNGSKNYPVKSPFDELSRTSLKTFLNAMTGADMTYYPVASMNTKDYFNLVNVYLDAVFFPLIYDDPRILQQEGWHYELTDKDSPIIYKGVVYNEMKGAFSSPYREMSYQQMKVLFPDNGYGLSSGGYPASIPELTNEEFIAFHKKNYHPSNSIICFYGDADMKKELELLDSKYLSHFEKAAVDNKIAIQKPFAKMKEATAPYSVVEGAPTENQTFLSLSWVVGLNKDKKLSMSLDVLSEVLVNQESAPIRLALQEAGIGKDVSAYNQDLQQNVLTIVVQNANPEDKDKFKEIVFNTLKEQSEKGIDKEAVEGYMNRMEFWLREGDNAQKGLTYMMQSVRDWKFSNDPFSGMEWEKPLAELKTAIGQKYLEQVIKNDIMPNNHSLLLTLEPKPGLENEIAKQTAAKLAEYKASLSDEQLEALIKETKELIEYQQREDKPEALATIPKLQRSDINTEAEWYEVEEKEVAGSKVLHFDEFTNEVVYTRLMFDLKTLSQEQLQYAALLTELLSKLNTENYEFGDLDKKININTGTFYSYVAAWKENNDDDKLIPQFIVVSKSMEDKVGKMFELVNEVITKTKYQDKERLKDVLTRVQSQLESSVKRNGINYARTRAASYYSNGGMFDELTGGFEFYWFVNKLVKDFDANSDKIVAELQKTAKLLFSKNNMLATTTCSGKNYAVFAENYTKFVEKMPENKVDNNEWKFELKAKNEGFVSASKVQYVIKGFNYKKLGHEWSGKMNVLNQILSGEWLQNQIRVIGGAYGGFAGISDDGNFYFASYRDPNLKETLDNYDATTGFLETFEADEAKMLGYIIGSISRLDRPVTPSQKGRVAVSRYFRKTTKEQHQADRTATLNTTAEDIKNLSKLVSDILAENVYCVYGNKAKIESHKDLFKNVLTLDNN